MARRAEEDARSEKAGRIVGAGMQPSTSSRREPARISRADQDHPVTASASKTGNNSTEDVVSPRNAARSVVVKRRVSVLKLSRISVRRLARSA